MLNFDNPYFALRNHFINTPGLQLTLQQAHDLWNAWPEPEQPIYLTEKALETLERDGMVRRVVGANTIVWQQ